jgi:hypothetical protein
MPIVRETTRDKDGNTHTQDVSAPNRKDAESMASSMRSMPLDKGASRTVTIL